MTGGAASSARLQVRLLGDFAVLVGRRRVPETAWRQRRAAAIIKLLALAPAHRLHREQITDTLWPALDRDAQANNLRQMLHLARKHLVAAGMPPGAVLTREGETVVLAPPAMTWVDAHAFEKAVADAWRAPSRASAQAALSLYGGDLLPTDLYDEWAEQPRIALRASYLALLMRLGQLHAERGAFADAIATFQRLVAAEPTHEAAHAALMRLYAGTSQRHLALGQYDRFAALLVREQDAEPEAQTRALAAAIRDGRHPAIATDLLLQKTQSGDDPPSAAGNLPTPLSTLIGREREIAEIGQLLATSRLVTLTGPGGIGKTRLAIAVARASGDAFPDGIFFVDLTPIRDPALVVPTIARALNVRAVSDEPLVATIVASLLEKRLLMVIDNFEHVASAARSVADILERSPSVKAVVTSRRRLRLRGEREHAVPPLSVPDAHGTANAAIVASAAVMLFVARAREARPDFALVGEQAGAVAAICRRLDGLPLAIELAAVRCTVLSPRAMLHRLAYPLALLSGGDDLPERQQTMRKTIEWSDNLLNADEQTLFRRLGVFLGGWTLEAAEAIAGDGAAASGDVLDGLHSLVDASLVTRREQPDGEVRFGMLETIREFALERLVERDEPAAVRDRHATRFIALAEEAAPHLETADQGEWLDRLERDDDNLRAALAWVCERESAELALRLVRALTLHWYVRGYLIEGYTQAMRAAALPQSAAFPVLRTDALNTAAFMAREFGDLERTYVASRESLSLSHQLHDRRRAADALMNLGFVALQRGELDDARELFRRNLATNRALRNGQGIADALSLLALTAFRCGDPQSARPMLEESIAIWNGLDDRQATIWAQTQLAPVLIALGADAEAYNVLMSSLRTAVELGWRWGFSFAFDGLARLAALHGAPHLAARIAAASAAVRETAGVRLSPLEHERVEELREDIRAAIGIEAFTAVWAQRQQWTLDTLLPAIEQAFVSLRLSNTAAIGIG